MATTSATQRPTADPAVFALKTRPLTPQGSTVTTRAHKSLSRLFSDVA
jgi:hypothetical protein